MSFPLAHLYQQLAVFSYHCVLTAQVAFVITEWTICIEVTQFVQWDPRSLVTVVLTLQCDVRTR